MKRWSRPEDNSGGGVKLGRLTYETQGRENSINKSVEGNGRKKTPPRRVTSLHDVQYIRSRERGVFVRWCWGSQVEGEGVGGKRAMRNGRLVWKGKMNVLSQSQRVYAASS